MDSDPQAVKPISDDQELAKVLAGVSQQTDAALQFDTMPSVSSLATPTPAADPVVAPVEESPVQLPPPTVAIDGPIVGYNPPAATQPTEAPSVAAPSPAITADLEDIKQEALHDLRPLVDKLDVPADEKFDTYLLLIRSTDDQSLIAPAYAAAQAIADETRKAQALLEIIKEIDYLSPKK